MLVSVPKVDVIPDAFDWWNAVMGLGGFVAAVVAIVLARRAQRTADEAIADERRRVFELDVLRDLMKQLGDLEFVDSVMRAPNTLARFSFELDLLSSRLPYWDRVIAMPDINAVLDTVGLGEAHRSAVDTATRANRSRESVLAELSKLKPQYVSDRDLSPRPRFEQLKAQSSELLQVEESAHRLTRQIQSEAVQKLAEKLAYDVNQAVLARVEARKHRRSLRWRWRYDV